METIHVVAAIIEKSGHVLATQRGYGEFKGGWEFPGGKVEPAETEEDAIVREIREELDARIVVHRHLCTVDYDYETFHLHMSCYLCSLASDHIDLLEHTQARWLDATSIDSVEWLPADISVLDILKREVFSSAQQTRRSSSKRLVKNS